MIIDPGTIAAEPSWLYRLRMGYVLSNADSRLVAAILAPLYDVWLKANPPCPTCRGSGIIHLKTGGHWEVGYSDAQVVSSSCPDCPDGVLPFDKWTAGLVAENAALQDALMAQAAIGADLAQVAFADLLPEGATWAGLVALWECVHDEDRTIWSGMGVLAAEIGRTLRQIGGAR